MGPVKPMNIHVGYVHDITDTGNAQTGILPVHWQRCVLYIVYRGWPESGGYARSHRLCLLFVRPGADRGRSTPNCFSMAYAPAVLAALQLIFSKNTGLAPPCCSYPACLC